MTEKYLFRRAESREDAKKLRDLFSEVFDPEDVGTLAETIFHHLPRMEKRYWFIAEDKATSTIASAFALIPWTWEMEGVRLKVAELGIVGTREGHRSRGLMRVLNQEFNDTLAEEAFDLAVIQGIPGFYHRFGFHYAIPLDNHIDLAFHQIPDDGGNDIYTFRLAGVEDIPFLMIQDQDHREAYSISSFRDEANWRYLLAESRKTEYGSEFWIFEHREKKEAGYFRVPGEGFGKGLIISEISALASHDALVGLLAFCKEKAMERNKPYIRLNLHNESRAGRMAVAMGSQKGNPYAWQIKIADRAGFLRKIAPILESRMKASFFKGFSGILRLEFFEGAVDLEWREGCLAAIRTGDSEECDTTFCIPGDLFPALCLGHRTWRELQQTRPDIFPALQYTGPHVATATDKSALLADTLFPAGNSWVNEQY